LSSSYIQTIATAMALPIPDVGRAGQAAGLAPGSEPLTRWGENPFKKSLVWGS